MKYIRALVPRYYRQKRFFVMRDDKCQECPALLFWINIKPLFKHKRERYLYIMMVRENKMVLFSHEARTSLKNHLTASMFGLTGASVLLLMLGLCMWPFPEKLTLAMYPVPNFDFSLIDVPMHRSFPFAIIAIRSPRISASSMEWVVKTIALPFLASSMMSQTCLLVIGSIPVVYITYT